MKTLYSFLFCLITLTASHAFSGELRECSSFFDEQNSSSPLSLRGRPLSDDQMRELSQQIQSGDQLDQYVPVVLTRLDEFSKEIKRFHSRVIGFTRSSKESRKLEKFIDKRKDLLEKFTDEMKKRIRKGRLDIQSVVYFYEVVMQMQDWFNRGIDYEFDPITNRGVKEAIKNKDANLGPIFSDGSENPFYGLLQYLAPVLVEQKLSARQWIEVEGTGVYAIEFRNGVTISDGQRMSPQLIFNRDIGHLVAVMNDYLQLKKDRQLRRWTAIHNRLKQAMSELPDDSNVLYVYYFILNEAPMRTELMKEIYGLRPLAPYLRQKMIAKLDRNTPEQIDQMIAEFFVFLNSQQNLSLP